MPRSNTDLQLQLDELRHLWPLRHNNAYVRSCIHTCINTIRMRYPLAKRNLRQRLYLQHCI